MWTPWSDGLTIGDVAGLIGGGISLVHTTIPLLAAVVIVGVLSRSNQTAATWSVASRTIQSSLWPVLLRGDASTSRHVIWQVVFYSTLVTIGTVVLVIAHLFTPLPLRSEILPEKTLKNVSFAYIPDESFFGQGTIPTAANTINRLCTGPAPSHHWWNCPNTNYNDPFGGSNYVDGQKIVNSTIPAFMIDAFSSGTKGTSISGPMDMRYRNQYVRKDPYIDGGSPLMLGGFQAFSTFMLENSYHLIEGAIVNSKTGGLCLRNHTMPFGLNLGASWTEDLLCIEPVSSCTNTNLTFGFTIDPDGIYVRFAGNLIKATLKDNGGFAQLSSEPPGPSWFIYNGPDATWNISVLSPNLESRSAQAAWWNNFFTMQALHITNPVLGHVYYNKNSFYNYTHEYKLPGAIEINPMDGYYLNDTLFGNGSIVNATDFSAFGRRCSAFEDFDPTGLTKPYMRCGYLYGVPEPALPGQSWNYDLGTNWSQPLYTCASTMKASVKTVHFESNGNFVLDQLQVVNITDKVYPNSSSTPLWGIERPEDFEIYGINLFWGMVADEYANDTSMTTIRSSDLYLPFATQGRYLGFWDDSFAAGSVFSTAWNSVYESAAVVAGIGVDGVPSYSGENNFEMTLKYRSLTTTPEGAAKLLNLIWTDFAAWSTVGTKTGFEDAHPSTVKQASGNTPAILGTREVYQHRRVIKYSNFLYAIPAFCAAGLWIFLLCSVVFLCCGCRIRWGMLHHYVNQTSAGRIASNSMCLPNYDQLASTDDWSRNAGDSEVLEVTIPRWDKIRAAEARKRNQEQREMRRRARRGEAGFQPIPQHGHSNGDDSLRGPSNDVELQNRDTHYRGYQPDPAQPQHEQQYQP